MFPLCWSSSGGNQLRWTLVELSTVAVTLDGASEGAKVQRHQTISIANQLTMLKPIIFLLQTVTITVIALLNQLVVEAVQHFVVLKPDLYPKSTSMILHLLHSIQFLQLHHRWFNLGLWTPLLYVLLCFKILWSLKYPTLIIRAAQLKFIVCLYYSTLFDACCKKQTNWPDSSVVTATGLLNGPNLTVSAAMVNWYWLCARREPITISKRFSSCV